MATVHVRRNQKMLVGKDAVPAFLKDRGLMYEFWGVERVNGHLKKSCALTPEDKQRMVNLYEPEISDLKIRQGYLTQDMVELSDATPNLDEVLRKFGIEHHHRDDEVRFVVQGSGVFTIRQDDFIFDVTVHAGDLMIVPAGTRHWFNLTPERRVQCIRIFKDPAGWAAVYETPIHLPY